MDSKSKPSLPAIPAKRYFSIGEVAELCDVKPHVLRYWEQEFTQLKPVKRRGNRRYYQHHEVLMIRRIRELLYNQGFTISGARNQLHETPRSAVIEDKSAAAEKQEKSGVQSAHTLISSDAQDDTTPSGNWIVQELQAIRSLLS